MSDPGDGTSPGTGATTSAVAPRRRRWVWPVVVGVLMLVAFAIGVFIASRTELFPPQVEGGAIPGSPTPGSTSTASPEVQPVEWRGKFRSRTEQSYREGVCRTAWAGVLSFEVGSDGAADGAGTVLLGSGPDCAFTVRQPQIDEYTFTVEGELVGRRLHLTWTDFERTGNGVVDYGGFAATIADPGTSVTMQATPGEDENAIAEFTRRAPTAEGVDAAESVTTVTVGCRRCS